MAALEPVGAKQVLLPRRCHLTLRDAGIGINVLDTIVFDLHASDLHARGMFTFFLLSYYLWWPVKYSSLGVCRGEASGELSFNEGVGVELMHAHVSL